MNLFSSLFSDNKSVDKPNLPWISITELSQLDEIIAESYKKPVLIFKHSTRCSISRFALKNFERDYNNTLVVGFYLLDLISYRAISNEISSKLNTEHQSPQILLIKNGVCVYNDSHQDIDFNFMMNKL